MTKPVLSIGIIFKNEIRCLERCLKSLQPLRAAVPCELVMADTGSEDGSREVAARYADILFDFPWVKDFSAARNAVMDRCGGVWYLSIDADEWLDPEIGELVTFLLADRPFNWASLHIYNYTTPELEQGGEYSDFIAMRLARLSTGIRYEGVVHERWEPKEQPMTTHLLATTVLHHDGYLQNDQARAQAKAVRNMELLEVKLSQAPDDLATLLQCAECAAGEETLRYVRQALEGGCREKGTWPVMGAPLLRQGVRAASETNSPELKEWIDRAQAEFPESVFVRIDVACYAFSYYLGRQDYDACIRCGEGYLRAVEDYNAGRFDRRELQYSVLNLCSAPWVRKVKIYLGDVYQRAGRTADAYAMLSSLDGRELDGGQTGEFVKALRYVHAHSDVDSAPLLLQFWEQIRQPGPVEGRERDREAAFVRTAAEVFDASYRGEEAQQADFRRPAYTLFLPLAGQCEAGTGAAILETEDTQALEGLLGGVEKWGELPIEALAHALECGAAFPCPGRPLTLEELDGLASRLARLGDLAARLAIRAAEEEAEGWQSLAWARALALAAVQGCGWQDEALELELSRAFARIEGAFLPRYYAPALLCEEHIRLLPPVHRFGWYCARAFQALDGGDAVRYVRLLREGLSASVGMKGMVEFLLQSTPQLQLDKPSAELLALAEQVRTFLAAYGPDDPAVAALKQSEEYQKVAYLIEGGLPS